MKYILSPGQTIVFSILVPKGKTFWSTTEIELILDPELEIDPMRCTVTRNDEAFVHTKFKSTIKPVRRSLIHLDSLGQIIWCVDGGRPIIHKLKPVLICAEPDVYVEFIIAKLLSEIGFKAKRLGGRSRPDVIAKRLSHPNFIIDIEATIQERYDKQKYGYDWAKYNSYKKEYLVNRLLIIYLSKHLDDSVKDHLKGQKDDISAMSMEQFLLLCRMFYSKSIDEDSFFAKIIRPGLSDIEGTISIENWLSRKINIRFEVDPDWRYPSPTTCLIQPVPLVELEILGTYLQVARYKGLAAIYEIDESLQDKELKLQVAECLEVIKQIGASDSDEITDLGRDLAREYESSMARFSARVQWLVYKKAGGKEILYRLRKVQNDLLKKRVNLGYSTIIKATAQSLVDGGYCSSIHEGMITTESILKWLQRGNLAGSWDSNHNYLLINETKVRQLEEHSGLKESPEEDDKYTRGELI